MNMVLQYVVNEPDIARKCYCIGNMQNDSLVCMSSIGAQQEASGICLCASRPVASRSTEFTVHNQDCSPVHTQNKIGMLCNLALTEKKYMFFFLADRF